MKSSKRSSDVASASWVHPSPLERVQKLTKEAANCTHFDAGDATTSEGVKTGK